MSQRELESAKEFRKFVQDEAEAQRLAEDESEYRKYCDVCRGDERHVAPAFRLNPLSLEQFRALMPNDPNPDVRGQAATAKDFNNRRWRDSQRAVKDGQLTDQDLFALGFDLLLRHEENDPIDKDRLTVAFLEFGQVYPAYDHAAQGEAIVDFLLRNRLQFNAQNLGRAYELLQVVGLLPDKTKPAEQPKHLNRHGINLNVERDPELEKEQARQQRRHDYYNKVVATDPLTKTDYTEAMLDQLSADDYKKLMFGFKTPTIRDVISSNLK